jgi:predicted metal-dependent hydrolase
MSEVFLINLPSGKDHYYTLKPSPRAKYIRIKLNSKGELSVTLPYTSSAKQAHRFIQSKSAWVAKQLSQLPEPHCHTVPDYIDLKLLDERWFVSTEENQTIPLQLDFNEDRKSVVFSGQIQQYDEFNHLLAQWLKQKARSVFNEMLESIAETHGFHYKRLSIRSQKTRWGSCSSTKNISLNCKLLFMPEKVVNYVMIHELCHTIQMNHSQAFWQLVEDCDPDFQAHRTLLKGFKSL